jgi:hypothetical protein
MEVMIDPTDLFSEQVLELMHLNYIEKFSDKKYDLKQFDDDCNKIKSLIVEMYKDDKEDIESFSDLIELINMITYEVISNSIFNDEQIIQIMKIRVLAKKQVKQKYRDYKCKSRKFWNHEEANQHYYALVEYVWKPSVKKVTELCNKYKS